MRLPRLPQYIQMILSQLIIRIFAVWSDTPVLFPQHMPGPNVLLFLTTMFAFIAVIVKEETPLSLPRF
jgi:hypothetical protein